MINQNSPEYEKETVILAQIDLTTGSIPKTLLRFAFPMICGNLLQQLYNVADTLIVGRFLGSDALGAVGSSYTLMTFLTSILLGLCGTSPDSGGRRMRPSCSSRCAPSCSMRRPFCCSMR